ncbi:MAG: carboxypeptidase regulatory-like domain-containing protein [Rhodothermales bacterium]
MIGLWALSVAPSVLALDDNAWLAANLRGFVTDASDGQPIEGVNVVLDDGSGLIGGITDGDGFYAITRIPAGTYELRISFIGYETQTEQLTLADGETRALNIELAPDEALMDELVVETERESGGARVTAGQQTIRPADIEMVPAPDVSADLVNYLTALPGVVATGDRGGQLFIRGGEPTHNLVLLDGMPVYQPFHVLGFYSAFPSDLLAKADVYAGGYGSQFSGRLSSVLDISTRNGNKKRFEGAISAAPFVSSLMVEGPVIRDVMSLVVSARKSVIEQAAALYIDEPLNYDFSDLFAKTHVNITPDHQASISVLHTTDKGLLTNPESERTPEEIRWSNTVYGLRYLIVPRSLPILGEFLFSVSRLDTEIGPRDEPNRVSEVGGFNTEINLTYYAGATEVGYGFYLRAPELRTNLGGLYQNIDSGFKRLPKFGAYLEPDLVIGEHLKVRPGVAIQNIGNIGFHAEPRLRVVYERGLHQWSGAFGRYHQDLVGLNDRRDATNVFTAWTVPPNDRLPRATHALVGYRVTPRAELELSVEGFYKRMTDMSIGEWTSFPRLTTRVQPASGRAYGIDLRAEWRLPTFYAYINYGLSNVRYNAQQETLELWYGSSTLDFRPPHDRRHQLNVVLSTKVAGFDMNVRWNYGSGLPYNRALGFDGYLLVDDFIDLFEAEDSRRVIYEEPYNGILPAYHRLDFSIDRTFEQKAGVDFTIQAGLINAYNRANLFALDLFTLERADQLPVIPTVGFKAAF